VTAIVGVRGSSIRGSQIGVSRYLEAMSRTGQRDRRSDADLLAAVAQRDGEASTVSTVGISRAPWRI